MSEFVTNMFQYDVTVGITRSEVIFFCVVFFWFLGFLGFCGFWLLRLLWLLEFFVFWLLWPLGFCGFLFGFVGFLVLCFFCGFLPLIGFLSLLFFFGFLALLQKRRIQPTATTNFDNEQQHTHTQKHAKPYHWLQNMLGEQNADFLAWIL